MLSRFLSRLVLIASVALAGCASMSSTQPKNVIGGEPLVCNGRETACAVHILGVIETADGGCTVRIDHDTVYVEPGDQDVDIIWTVDPKSPTQMQADSIELKDTNRYANFDQRYPIHDEQRDALPMHAFHWRTHNIDQKDGNRYPYTLVLYDAAHGNRRCVGDPAVISPGRP